MDDTWWAFVATIDHQTLLLELPGSVLDRRMREKHAEYVKTFYAPGNGSIRTLAVESNEKHVAATVKRRASKPVTELDHTLAAYAARKRKKAA